MFLGFCYKGFHWPTIIVIMAEGKEDKMRGCCEKNLRGGGYAREGKEDKMRGGWGWGVWGGVVAKQI